MRLAEAIACIEAVLDRDALLTRAAWRIVKRAALRGQRISSSTLPRIADTGQHAVLARDAIDALKMVVPDRIADRLDPIRDHVVAIIAACSDVTEPPSNPEPAG